MTIESALYRRVRHADETATRLLSRKIVFELRFGGISLLRLHLVEQFGRQCDRGSIAGEVSQTGAHVDVDACLRAITWKQETGAQPESCEQKGRFAHTIFPAIIAKKS